jgi:hypothetical protein
MTAARGAARAEALARETDPAVRSWLEGVTEAIHR